MPIAATVTAIAAAGQLGLGIYGALTGKKEKQKLGELNNRLKSLYGKQQESLEATKPSRWSIINSLYGI